MAMTETARERWKAEYRAQRVYRKTLMGRITSTTELLSDPVTHRAMNRKALRFRLTIGRMSTSLRKAAKALEANRAALDREKAKRERYGRPVRPQPPSPN